MSNYTYVPITEQEKQSAIFSAYRITMSPHEWIWNEKEQKDMATFILWQFTQLQAANERIQKLERVKRLADNVMIDWNEDRCDPDEFNVLMQFREDLRNAIRACEEKETP